MEIEEILARIPVYLDRIKRKWLAIILIALVPAILMVWQALSKPSLYVAKTVFHPETGQQNGSNRGNALSLILGNPGEGGETGFMIGVLKSRNISEAVTSDTIDWKGEQQLVADIISNAYPKSYSLLGYIQNLLFPPSTSTSYQSKVLSTASAIRSSMFIEATPDGFINLDISFYTQEMAGLISRLYIKNLNEYYTRQKTAKASNNVTFFTRRADSIQRELEKTSRSLARYYDRNQNLVFTEDQVVPTELLLRQDIQKQMFVTLTLTKEQALAQLQQDTPIIQILDHPNPPYKSMEANPILYGTIGFIIGLILAMFLISRKLLKEDLNQLIQAQLYGKSNEPEAIPEESEEETEL
jgi:hypothetical protein